MPLTSNPDTLKYKDAARRGVGGACRVRLDDRRVRRAFSAEEWSHRSQNYIVAEKPCYKER